mmetsp:Transcript_9146/g.21547  ORF Transcript_9146/g.21547 Transcript_9146/m.21547 type:complete len:107 (+) Transcript_9146:2738-3058(+)
MTMCRDLEYVDLSGMDTLEGDAMRFGCFAKARELVLWDCERIDGSKSDLQDALPFCKISTAGTGMTDEAGSGKIQFGSGADQLRTGGGSNPQGLVLAAMKLGRGFL